MIEWQKENSSTWLGYVGKYHMFTVIDNGFSASLMPHFYGYESKGSYEEFKNIKCPGGFIQAKREAEEKLSEFLQGIQPTAKE